MNVPLWYRFWKWLIVSKRWSLWASWMSPIEPPCREFGGAPTTHVEVLTEDSSAWRASEPHLAHKKKISISPFDVAFDFLLNTNHPPNIVPTNTMTYRLPKLWLWWPHFVERSNIPCSLQFWLWPQSVCWLFPQSDKWKGYLWQKWTLNI